MQHHELKKYLESTVYKKLDKKKKHKKFCMRTDRKFLKFYYQTRLPSWLLMTKREQGLNS